MSFPWTCPFCNHKTTIIDENHSHGRHEFACGNKYGYQVVATHVIACPNEACREYTLSVSLHDYVWKGNSYKEENPKKTWNLIPQAAVKVYPDYIPKAILADYSEACLIRDLSPKASATLARRCLQGMIRDFWGITKKRLIDEIEAIQNQVDPVTWGAIDAVRKIGNIGAHMEKDINLIVDVEPREAGLLIGLIETLLSDWYVEREERKKRMEAIIEVAAEKAEAKAIGASGDSSPEA
jgi:hypothetical protein